MKITLANSLYYPYQIGGAEKSVQLLAEALSRQGHEVSVITLHEGESVNRYIHNNVQVIAIPLSNNYWPYDHSRSHGLVSRIGWHLRNIWNSATAAAAGRALDDLRPDVVHVNVPTGFSAALLSEILSRKIRLVQTLRDLTFLCERAGMFRSGKNCVGQCTSCRLFTSQYKRLSSRVSAVVSNSQYILDLHLQNGYFSNVPAHVIFNVANVGGGSIPRVNREPSNKSLTFGYFGRILKEKGLNIVFEATKRLKNQNWSLKVGGSGPADYVATLKDQYKNAQIEWLGFLDPQRFFEQVDVVVVPSIWAEPLPRSMIEAFAAGRTVIASRSGGNPEVATLGKKYATYDAEDVDRLAQLMDDALSEPEPWLEGGFSSEDKALFFSEETVTKRYLQVYQGSNG